MNCKKIKKLIEESGITDNSSIYQLKFDSFGNVEVEEMDIFTVSVDESYKQMSEEIVMLSNRVLDLESEMDFLQNEVEILRD